MRTEQFEVTPEDPEVSGDQCHLIRHTGRNEIMWLEGTVQLQELYILLGRYLGNYTNGGKTDLDLREDG